MQTTEQRPLSEQIRIRNSRLEKAQRHLFKRSDYFIDGKVEFQSGSQSRSGFQLALWSWMSAFIDSLILISISCFSIILLSFLMKSPARDFIRVGSLEPNRVGLFLISFSFSFWVYMVTMRVFMGASLGEWSCQLRLGQPVERIRSGYVLRVIARTTILLITGVITIPILSLILKKDILGDLTGVRIYSLT